LNSAEQFESAPDKIFLPPLVSFEPGYETERKISRDEMKIDQRLGATWFEFVGTGLDQ